MRYLQRHSQRDSFELLFNQGVPFSDDNASMTLCTYCMHVFFFLKPKTKYAVSSCSHIGDASHASKYARAQTPHPPRIKSQYASTRSSVARGRAAHKCSGCVQGEVAIAYGSLIYNIGCVCPRSLWLNVCTQCICVPATTCKSYTNSIVQ